MRIRAILAALRRAGARGLRRVPAARLWPALAGMLLIALLSDAAVLPVAAAPATPAVDRSLAAAAMPASTPAAASGDGLPTVGWDRITQADALRPTPQGTQPPGWHARPAAPSAASLMGASAGDASMDARQAGSAQAASTLPAPQAGPGPQAVSAPTAPSTRQLSLAVDGAPLAPSSPLERRLQRWPDWTLPAPLPRPGRQAPTWPSWFSGTWLVESETLPTDPAMPPQSNPPWRARFRPDDRGGAVADRACNAFSLGRSLLGEQLLSVQDDPGNPQRQLARLATDLLLETSLIGQRGETPEPDRFLNDELSLQVLHGPGEPRVSRIETLGRWRRLSDGSIDGEQWQARYDSPAAGLAAAARSTDHWRLRLVPVPPGSDRATETAAPAGDCR